MNRKSGSQKIPSQIAIRPARGTPWWLFAVLCPFFVFGQTNNPTAIYPSNRFLLVVETSRLMQPRVAAMARSVQDLLGSALAAQARRGDTLGVWTFNEDLYSGVLPLQQWSPESQKSITDRVVGFLSAQRFEKQARFDNVLAALDRVVRNSPFLTIILVCVGEEEIHRTPFDERINNFFQTWRLQQQTARTPFIIALRAQAGKYVDCAMNPAPWPAELPPLPNELFVALPPPVSAAAEPRKPSLPKVAPLIISGKKRDANLPVKSSEPIEPRPQVAVPAMTNLAAQPQPTVAASQETSPKTAAISPTQTAAPDKTAPTSPPLAVTATPASPPAIPDTPKDSQQTTVLQPTAAGSASTKAAQPGSDSLPNLKPVPRSNMPSTGSTALLGSVQPSTPEVASHPMSTQTSLDSSRTPVEIASAAPARSRFHPIILGVAGVVFIAAAVSALWFLRRRRPVEQASLITESIDRRKR